MAKPAVQNVINQLSIKKHDRVKIAIPSICKFCVENVD